MKRAKRMAERDGRWAEAAQMDVLPATFVLPTESTAACWWLQSPFFSRVLLVNCLVGHTKNEIGNLAVDRIIANCDIMI